MLIYGDIIFILIEPELNQGISCFLQFRSNHFLLLSNIYCKRHQCRRNINFIKCTGHTILTADRRKTISNLRIISTKQCCKRLTPTLRVRGHSAEVFLECKTDFAKVTTGCHYLCHRFCYCINSTMIRIP